MRKIFLILAMLVLWALFPLSVAGDQPIPLTPQRRAEMIVDGESYDFFSWTLSAFWFKLEQHALGLPGYMDLSARKRAVSDYFRLTDEMMRTEARLESIYSDPTVTDAARASLALNARLDAVARQRKLAQPFAEAVMEEQVAQVMRDEGLSLWGQLIPPVSAHISPLPYDLVVSYRDHIEQRFTWMLRPDLQVDDFERLENQMDAALDVSSLVVPIGGLSAYPTMVQRTADLSWTLQTFAHEWTHNYLAWHALGSHYGDSPELRTMNETTADIVGKEVSQRIMAQFYTEETRRGAPFQAVSWHPEHKDPRDWPRPVFDFRAEMHATRVRVDDLLAQGRIEEAEAYMQNRRLFFWWMGYPLRKLNQAYFAFYGAYADVPGGAAGEDPVGPAVRALRAQSASLGDFVRRMSALDSFEALRSLLGAQ